MNSGFQNQGPGQVHSAVETGEETLRFLASLQVPEGLEGRILMRVLRRRREGRVPAWPGLFRLESGWGKAAAAAAIVFVVGAGGWGVYSRVQPHGQPEGIMSMPVRLSAPGGFSGAGAIRTPQTIKGPVLTEPANARPVQGKRARKAVAHPATTGHSNSQAFAGQAAAAPEPAAK